MANRKRKIRSLHAQRGAAAVLAMMFLVIFASLATAMAIVAHGNLRTADSHLKMNRALASCDTGMRFVLYFIEQTLKKNAATFSIREGYISEDLATDLWSDFELSLIDELRGHDHNILDPDYAPGKGIKIGPIRMANAPSFTAVLVQHPIPADLPEGHPLYGHSYDSDFYDRPPYDGTKPETGILTPVSSTNPLDSRWIRLRVQAVDGPTDLEGNPVPGSGAVTRSISMDFKLEKKIKAAILSKSRVMIGRNVMIEGRIGSTFTEVNLENGHPIQMESDFRGLDPSTGDDGLDAKLDALVGSLLEYDADGDNRIKVAAEVPPGTDRAAMAAFDYNKDGYVDDFDIFFQHFDADKDNKITQTELESGNVPTARAEQLIELIDKFHDNDAEGNEGVIDFQDRYTKVRGEVVIKADRESWEEGAADGPYQDHFQGPITPDHGENPLTFDADDSKFPDFDQHSFDTSTYLSKTEGDVITQAQTAEPWGDGTPKYDPQGEIEPVPFGATYPYDYYERPVFENMTFKNARIPKGTNALFKNCRFIGVTYIETDSSNFIPHPSDPDRNAFNYAGTQEADGTPKHPDLDADPAIGNTKARGNNIRFHNCRFEGAIVSGDSNGKQPAEFSHTRNKLTFTGDTQFPDVMDQTEAPDLDAQERDLYRRGTIITPHYSLEMGTFIAPYDSNEVIHLSGTIVAGLIDMRGKVSIDGSVLTTFEPKSDEGPVLGETSPQFNTTLGYFSSKDGDMETELPDAGTGIIKVKYNPNIPLPDGVKALVSLEPVLSTYSEGGAAAVGD